MANGAGGEAEGHEAAASGINGDVRWDAKPRPGNSSSMLVISP